VTHRRKQLRVEASKAREILRIDAIVLAVVLVDEAQLPRVRDDDLVVERPQEQAHPG
jgi:hypothetical protein